MRKILSVICIVILLSLAFGCARQQDKETVEQKVQEQPQQQEQASGDEVTIQDIDQLLEDIETMEVEDPGGLSE
ncbi:hypothetical protein KY316_01225 [Candidatus Woesearchaeota archaeon]|nr:hypothetical protein [Candidatus Woesearchaeota archaeon]